MLGAQREKILRLENSLLRELDLLAKEDNEERKDERKNLKEEKPMLR